jgi:hypothetical protein
MHEGIIIYIDSVIFFGIEYVIFLLVILLAIVRKLLLKHLSGK